ncbi:MAG: PilZ domain-containing protein [Deltaproteobacteria bacterium]|nr:PilZ domain-containing protein [Deltaproteobacteria bacterium]
MPVAPWILPVLWREHDWREALERLVVELAGKDDGPALERAAVELAQAYEYVEPDRRRAIDVYGLAGGFDDGRACKLAAELAWWPGRARLLVARRAYDRSPVLVLDEAEAWWDAGQPELSALALAGVRNVDSPRIEDLAELLGDGDRAAQAQAAAARAADQAPADAAASLVAAARFAKAGGATADAARYLEAALGAAPGHAVAAGHLLALALASREPETMRGYLRARLEKLPPQQWIDGMRASAFAMIESRHHRGFGLRLLRRALERVYESKLPEIPGHLAMWTVLAAHASADGTRRELMPLVLTALQSTQRPVDRVWLGALATEISLRDAGSAIVAGAYAEIVAEYAPEHPVVAELVVAVAASGESPPPSRTPADGVRTPHDRARTASDAVQSGLDGHRTASDATRAALYGDRTAAATDAPDSARAAAAYRTASDVRAAASDGVVKPARRSTDSTWELDESAVHQAVPIAPPPELVSTTITTRHHTPSDHPALAVPVAAVAAAHASLEQAVPVDVEVELAGVYADATLAATATPDVFEGEIEMLDEDSAPVAVSAAPPPAEPPPAPDVATAAPLPPVVARTTTGPARVTVSIPKVLPPPRLEEPKHPTQRQIAIPAIAIPKPGERQKTLIMPSIAKRPGPAASAVPTAPPLPPILRAAPPPPPTPRASARKPTRPQLVLDALRTPDRPPIAPRPPEPPNARPRSRRISIPIDVRLILPDGTRVSGHSRDLSTTGLFVLTTAALPDGAEVDVELLLPGKEAFTEDEHRARARIARRDDDGVGIELLDPDARLTAALDDL